MIRRLVPATFLAVAVVAELAACGGDPAPPLTVGFAGTLVQQRFVSSDPQLGIAGADVFVTSSSGALLSQTTTDANGGFFAGGLPKEIPTALVFSKTPDYARTVFTTDSESHDALLFYGAVFEPTIADAEKIVAEYAAAASVTSASLMTFDPAATTSTAGAMVRGRVVRLVQTPAGLAYMTVDNATVTVTDGNGVTYPVFYRGDFPNDNDPGPIDPARTKTGTDSRFVAFGIDAKGLSTLPFEAGPVTVSVTVGGTTITEQTIAVLGGVTELDLFTVP